MQEMGLSKSPQAVRSIGDMVFVDRLVACFRSTVVDYTVFGDMVPGLGTPPPVARAHPFERTA